MTANPVTQQSLQTSSDAQTSSTNTFPSSEVLIRGTVTRITFFKDDTGFTVLRAEVEGEAGETTLVGELASQTQVAVPFIARGKWISHAKFGKQFRFFSFTEAPPTEAEGLIRYLSSGLIKGFGPVLAQRVVETFGEATLQILDDTPERLLEVPGVGQKKYAEIVTAWQEKRDIRDVLLFFQQYGISVALAQRIYQSYGRRAVEIVSHNPYLLAREMWGVGFRTADRIAQALGLAADAPERIVAGVLHCIRSAADEGHCYLTTEELLKRAKKLLEIEQTDLIESALPEISLRGEIVVEDVRIYTPEVHLSEMTLAKLISQQMFAHPEPSIPAELVQECREEQYQAQDGSSRLIRLSPDQQQALSLAAEHQLVVITGGPGCGKTTVLRAVSRMFRKAGLRVKLAAPTGRAAQRMSEVCSMEASTIHRLLRFDPSSREFVHSREDPLPLDVLIVDESSMIDLPLAHALFSAIPESARLIVVGDADQLPSVGPGRILADMLEVSSIPRVRLSQLFRREEESRITQIAHTINKSLIPKIPTPDGVTQSDAYFLAADSIGATADLVERVVVEQIPKKFGLRSQEIMVLTPMNQGEIGVIALNKRLQQRLVPPQPGLPHIEVGNNVFRLGDRVIQRVNNYQLHTAGVYNGDQGEIIGIDAEARLAYVRLWDGREIEYPSETLSQLDLAYALTIHRSQGTEVPAVVLVLHETHSIMLERQLVYTAVTRAKRLLLVIGTQLALTRAVQRNRSSTRNTSLVHRVEEFLV